MSDLSPVQLATRFQNKAADPRVHVGLTANAGSGKTRVLVNRVVRLLLQGAAPDAIVCLTYTKAAASEMQGRLFDDLGRWSVLDDDGLAAALAKLDPGAARDADGLRTARALFASALETPGGLKIQTIHAFCERVLRRFPVEAGVSAGFQTLDDAMRAVLLERARKAVGERALSGDAALADAMASLAARAADQDFAAFFEDLAQNVAQVAALASPAGLAAAHAALNRLIGEGADADADAVAEAAMAQTPREPIAMALRELREGKKTDNAFADRIAAALRVEDAVEAFNQYRQAVLNFYDDEGWRGGKQAPTKAVRDAGGPAAQLFEGASGSEVLRLVAAQDRWFAARAGAFGRAGQTVAGAFAQAYAREKRRAGALDYDDLLAKASALLRAEGGAGWALFKLDGGVDHVLVDEAQDTSPEAWALIEALTGEFFAGAGARETPRTVFLVGDEKQSIYSFQGARPIEFLKQTRRLVAQAPDDAIGPQLAVSFRSAPTVLQVVDAVMADVGWAEEMEAEALNEAPDTANRVAHVAARDDHEGCVELWPPAPRPDAAKDAALFPDPDANAAPTARAACAHAIAARIKGWVEGGAQVADRSLDWTARPMAYEDVMILVRKRSGIFQDLARALPHAGVPISGVDRMVLADELAAQDLLNAARVALAPGDDLAVAELLKSPFAHPVGEADPPIGEAALFQLAHGRGRASLLSRVTASQDPGVEDAQALIAAVERIARAPTPHAALAGFLAAASATGEPYAARLFHRLGGAARDAVDETLARARKAEAGPAPSLQRFVEETLRDRADVKRELAQPDGAVRMLTVHGAKGLEAPVVILADAWEPDRRANNAMRASFDHDCGVVWALGGAKVLPRGLGAMQRAAEAAQAAENARLLYVAMTRAQDRLIVAGGGTKTKTPDQVGWGAVIKGALEGIGAKAVPTPFGEGLALGAPLADGAAWGRASTKTPVSPAWTRTPPPAAPGRLRTVAPSRLLDPTPPERVASPLFPSGTGRAAAAARGRVIHKLLQTLPDVAADRRNEAAHAFLAAQPDIDPAEREAIAGEVFGVLSHPGLTDVFGPGSRAEAAVAGTGPGLPEGAVVSGQVDRLLVTPERVTIVDFKSNRPPPQEVGGVSRVYLAQMAAYRAVFRGVDPDRPVDCVLVWTHAPSVMALPDSALDAAWGAG